MQNQDELPALFVALQHQGFCVEVRADGRAMITREGRFVVTFRGCDWRARRNAIVQARREGFVWPTHEGGPGQG